MRKIKKVVLVLIMVLTTVISLASCDNWKFWENKKSYVATSDFYWSSDGGATYKNGTKEYNVGENVYMQLVIKVENSSKKQEKVGVTLTIPYVQDVVSKYYDGQVITPEIDELNHMTIYNFDVIASKNASDSRFIFKFVPTKATDITLTLTFDDKIDSIYDKQNTVTFIAAPETKEE